MSEKDSSFFKVVSLGATFILFGFTVMSGLIGWFGIKYVEQIEHHAQETDLAVKELNLNLNRLNINLSEALLKITRTERELEYNRKSIEDIYRTLANWEGREAKYWKAMRSLESKVNDIKKRSSYYGKSGNDRDR